jgi:hypothetical protein
MVVYSYNSSYTGGIGRRIIVLGQPWGRERESRFYLKNSIR